MARRGNRPGDGNNSVPSRGVQSIRPFNTGVAFVSSPEFRNPTPASSFTWIFSRGFQSMLPVTCGITPAHFMLSDLATVDFRTFARLSPPLRAEDDRLAVIQAVADGLIDVICSMHTPQAEESKRLPFEEAASGAVGLQTLLLHMAL